MTESLVLTAAWAGMALGALLVGPRVFTAAVVGGLILMVGMTIYMLAMPVLLVREGVKR